MKHTCVLAAAGLIPAASAGAQAPKATISQTRPNIVFLMAEDLSTESFALYNGHGAHAPNLERMAAHGIVFNNAYSCAPVSSAARSSLFTGCYAPSMGLSWHRKLEPVTLPEDIHIFPWYLQQAGYHTTNVQKTDYNFVGNEDGWDNVKARIGAWRKRPS